jgi:hypothetical protein
MCVLLAEKMNYLPQTSRNEMIIDLKVPLENSLIGWLFKAGVDGRFISLMHEYRKVVRNDEAHKYPVTNDSYKAYCKDVQDIFDKIDALEYPLFKDSYALFYVDQYNEEGSCYSGVYRNEAKKVKRFPMPEAYSLKMNHLYLVKQCNGILPKDSVIDISAFVDTDP